MKDFKFKCGTIISANTENYDPEDPTCTEAVLWLRLKGLLTVASDEAGYSHYQIALPICAGNLTPLINYLMELRDELEGKELKE